MKWVSVSGTLPFFFFSEECSLSPAPVDLEDGERERDVRGLEGKKGETIFFPGRRAISRRSCFARVCYEISLRCKTPRKDYNDRHYEVLMFLL